MLRAISFEECLDGAGVLRETEPGLSHAEQDRLVFDGCHNRREAYTLFSEFFEIDWLLHLHSPTTSAFPVEGHKPSIIGPAIN